MQVLITQFVFCCGLALVDFTHSLQGYLSGIGIVLVLVKQPSRIWVSWLYKYTENQ